MDIDLTKPANLDPAEHAELLDDLQGNILKGHGREYVRLLLIRFSAPRAIATRWLRAFGRAGWLPSASAQAKQTSDWLDRGQDALFANLFLTCPGYRYIGVPDAQIPADSRFRAGLVESRSIINDPPSNQWSPPYDPVVNPIHAMVLLAASTPFVLEDKERYVTCSLKPIADVRVQTGAAIKETGARFGPSTRYVEHFNYLDGRSQPLFLREDLDEEAMRDGPGGYDPSAPLGLVLTREAGDGAHYGSYLVYRKLEQNVRGFKERERKPEDGTAPSLADQLGMEGEDRKRVGAMIVGRFEKGTPLALASSDELPSAPNNFDYADDREGLKCPLFAHIRKINPRTPESRNHRIVRRGITYEDVARKAPPSEEQAFEQMPVRGVGLLFMCFQSSIADQFEYLQVRANDPNFPEDGAGPDPLIAQPIDATTSPLRWAKTWGAKPTIASAFGNFTRLMEGEYFFAPSKSFLRNLPSTETSS